MEFVGTETVLTGDDQVSYEVQTWLNRLIESTNGKTAREPIHALMKRANDLEDSTLVTRVLIATLIVEFIQSSTTNPEVVGARNNFDLLHLYLADIDSRLGQYEEILEGGLYIPPIGDIEDTSNVTFILLKGGS